MVLFNSYRETTSTTWFCSSLMARRPQPLGFAHLLWRDELNHMVLFNSYGETSSTTWFYSTLIARQAQPLGFIHLLRRDRLNHNLPVTLQFRMFTFCISDIY